MSFPVGPGVRRSPMARTEREVVTRLGIAGLTRVLNDVLDQNRLVRLANAAGISYPGMRTQSQKRLRLVADLVEKAARDDAATLAIVRALRKETASFAKEWSALSQADRVGRLSDAASANGRLGGYLFVAASAVAEAPVENALEEMLSRGQPTEPSGEETAREPESKEAQRLRKKCAELQKKVRYLEGQIAKTRDLEKANKRDLLQRKGELAEARMLAERLRRELDEARSSAGDRPAAAKAPAPETAVDEIDRSVKRLVTEQRRLAHRIEKIAESPAPAALP